MTVKNITVSDANHYGTTKRFVIHDWEQGYLELCYGFGTFVVERGLRVTN